MTPLCILCGKPLNKGKTNREHYVPQVLIRNFYKLGVSSKFTHALRIDMREDEGEITLAPRSSHYDWATVVVHEQCNLDASKMCQDLKKIIDDLGGNHRTDRILAYYAHIWGMQSEDLTFVVDKCPGKQDGSMLIYDVGHLSIGRIRIESNKAASLQNYEKHQIHLGTMQALEDIIKNRG